MLEDDKERVSYEDLHKHVVQYSKTKNPEDAEFILNAFDRMIWIYVHIIVHGRFKLTSERHRDFVGLYCPRWVYLKRNYYNKSDKVRASLFDAAQHIQYIFRKYDEDEIRTECQIVILNMALKYEIYDKPTFHTLVSRVFEKRLFSHLKKMVKDPFVRKHNIEIGDVINDCSNGISEQFLLDKMEESYWHGENDWHKDYEAAEKRIDHHIRVKNSDKPILEQIDIQELSLDWLNGSVCHPLFKDLNITERKILKLYYFNNMTDREVAEHMNFCSSYTNKKRNKIIKKIFDKYEEIRSDINE